MLTLAEIFLRRVGPLPFVIDDNGADLFVVILDNDGIARVPSPLNEGLVSSVTSPGLSGPVTGPLSSITDGVSAFPEVPSEQ